MITRPESAAPRHRSKPLSHVAEEDFVASGPADIVFTEAGATRPTTFIEQLNPNFLQSEMPIRPSELTTNQFNSLTRHQHRVLKPAKRSESAQHLNRKRALASRTASVPSRSKSNAKTRASAAS